MSVETCNEIMLLLVRGFRIARLVAWLSGGLFLVGQESVWSAEPARELREYRNYAMGHEGDAIRGRELFNNEQRVGCAKCHSVDGSSSRAGPDLFTIGDSYPRPELIRSVLEPSASIAIGYGTTMVETKSDETFSGVVKQVKTDTLELMGAEGKLVRIPTAEIKELRESTVSLMPEGLQAGMSRQEFTDLIEYLATLKDPQSALANNRGMPANIPELAKPIGVHPFFSEDLRFPHSFVPKPGDVRSGLVLFGQISGACPRNFLSWPSRLAYTRSSARICASRIRSFKSRGTCVPVWSGLDNCPAAATFLLRCTKPAKSGGSKNPLRTTRRLCLPTSVRKFSTSADQTGCWDSRSIRSFCRPENII